GPVPSWHVNALHLPGRGLRAARDPVLQHDVLPHRHHGADRERDGDHGAPDMAGSAGDPAELATAGYELLLSEPDPDSKLAKFCAVPLSVRRGLLHRRRAPLGARYASSATSFPALDGLVRQLQAGTGSQLL